MVSRAAQDGARKLGPFEIVRPLPPGGMADLFLVYPPGGEGGEPLVLKVVQARYRDNDRVAALLRDEALIGGMLRHRNLVRVLEHGELEGVGPYLCMAFIPGRDLVALLRRCVERRLPFPRDLAVHVCTEVARGLAHAHDLRTPGGEALAIIHCDVSPGNVMISPSGAVTLVDFGVARANLTLHCPDRGVAGKYNYMAPEQIRNEPLDHRADLFSLAVILYELTVGERLFRGPPEAVMNKVLEQPIPPPRQKNANYPAELEQVVMRALERDPDDRYQSAVELVSDLQGYLARRGGPPPEAALSRLLLTAFARSELEAVDAPDSTGSPVPGRSPVSVPAPVSAPAPSVSVSMAAPAVPLTYEESAAFVFEPKLPDLPPRKPSGLTPRAPSGVTPPRSTFSPPRLPSGMTPQQASVISLSSATPVRLPADSSASLVLPISAASPPASSSSPHRPLSATSPPPLSPHARPLPISAVSPRPLSASSRPAAPLSSLSPPRAPSSASSSQSPRPPSPSSISGLQIYPDLARPATFAKDLLPVAAPRQRRRDPVWVATGLAALVLIIVLAYLALQLQTKHHP